VRLRSFIFFREGNFLFFNLFFEGGEKHTLFKALVAGWMCGFKLCMLLWVGFLMSAYYI
jgi:hypothetical protein